MIDPLRRLLPAAPLLLGAACGGGSSSTPIGSGGQPPELLACRARIDNPHGFAEIALRTAQNLGNGRVADRAGRERHARLHPDGNTVVFARERTAGEPQSRELFTSTLDGSRGELRLTLDTALDDEPCWSPAGESILFASERAGSRALWLCAADGSNVRQFLSPPPGGSDGEPDWCRATNRVAWSRRDGNGHHSLWLVHGDGTGIVQLTDGGSAQGPDRGDHHPAFSPDGSVVAFARRTGSDAASLCAAAVATGAVTVLHAGPGEADLPRFCPAGDRILFGLAEPRLGRGTLRLAMLPAGGGEPVLLWPDERWRLEGVDALPALPAAPAAAAPVPLDVTGATIQIAAGNGQYGARAQLAAADGDEFTVLTETSGGHEIAGINCRFDLPVAAAEHVLELRVRAVARVGRTGGDTALRMSVYNPVDERFDTAVELLPLDTAPHTLGFRTASLRHVTRERQFRVTVVGEIAAGARSELRVDLVEVVLVARASPP